MMVLIWSADRLQRAVIRLNTSRRPSAKAIASASDCCVTLLTLSVGLFARRPADVVIVGGEPPLVF